VRDNDLRERKRAWESAPSRETERAFFAALARSSQLPEASEVRGRERWTELVTKLDHQLADYLPRPPLPLEERLGISRQEFVSAMSCAGDQAAIRAAIHSAGDLLGRALPTALVEAHLLLFSLPTFRYGNQDHVCWPGSLEIDRRSERGPVVVFAHENQGVAQWGFWLDTPDEDPEMLIAFEESHWRTTSARIVESLTRHVGLSPLAEWAQPRIRERLAACGRDSRIAGSHWPPRDLSNARPDCSRDLPRAKCPWCAPETS
jgi:hypothetical protein